MPVPQIRLILLARATALPIGVQLLMDGNTMDRPRVMLADNHRLVREAFTALLEPHCEVVRTVSDGLELLTAAPALNPDVVILETALSRLNGLDAGRRLKGLMPQVKLIFLTASEDPDLAAEAFRAGASSFLLKNSAGSELLQAIREVTRGGRYVTPLGNRGVVGPEPLPPRMRKRNHGLNPRRREVLQLLAEGHSMKQAARMLNLSPRTIAYHKYGLMEELGLRNSAKLIQYAIRRQLVPA
jgi:DNA-binding NarL/FixJ family response regulator